MNSGFPGPDELIRLKEEFLLPCVYHFYQRPPQVVRGEGPYLYDSEGREYLDFYSGVSVNALGHGDKDLAEAIACQARTLAHTTTIYLTQPMLELARTLASITPDGLRKTFFCASGSGANETGVLLARNYKRRKRIVSLGNSLHGNTRTTMGLTGLSFWRTDPWPREETVFAPVPYCYRCPLGLEYGRCDIACAAELDRRISDEADGPPAALVMEVVQGNGGIIVPPCEYFERLGDILKKHDVLLVVDEVQTGFGRTGRMFASEHFGLRPDVMTVAKALGGGLPAGAAIATDEIACAFKGPRASTFGGNLVAMRAGQTVIEKIQKRDLMGNAAAVGSYFKEKLLALKEQHPIIGDVRGLGLMLGVELVLSNKDPATERADMALEMLKDLGVFAGKTGAGRNVLTFQPPLTVTEAHVDKVVSAVDESLRAAPGRNGM